MVDMKPQASEPYNYAAAARTEEPPINDPNYIDPNQLAMIEQYE